MSLLNFNASEVAPSTGFDPIPAGKYVAVISDSEMRSTNSGTGQYLRLEFTIIDGEYANRKLWTRLNLDNPNPDAIERERIREQIEEEAIRPFIECLNSCGKVTPVKDFTITPQPPLFDTNAVSLLLRFSVTYKLCW